jgi:hypothetical protein
MTYRILTVRYDDHGLIRSMETELLLGSDHRDLRKMLWSFCASSQFRAATQIFAVISVMSSSALVILRMCVNSVLWSRPS